MEAENIKQKEVRKTLWTVALVAIVIMFFWKLVDIFSVLIIEAITHFFA